MCLYEEQIWVTLYFASSDLAGAILAKVEMEEQRQKGVN